MALIVLMILTALTVAWATLAVTEPVVANNHRLAAVARAFAESGLERAAWGLSHDTRPAGLAVPAAGAVAGPPYDGKTFIRVNTLGGFTLRVRGVSVNAADVEAFGWTPDNTPGNAHRRITARLSRVRDLARDAPCALCVRGDVDVAGRATLDARQGADAPGPRKVGIFSTGGITRQGNGADVYGADGNDVRNEPTDYAENQPATEFDKFTLTPEELNTLRGLARANATYYRGSVTFNSQNPLPNGIVFVDTVSGTSVTSTTSASDLADVTLSGGAVPQPPFTGWFIVNGDLDISGNFGGIAGIVYVVGQARTTGFVNSSLTGLMVVQQARGGSGFSAGNTDIQYDYEAARGGGYVPENWFVQAGTYREVAD